ncbi:MAG: hypothetical protein GY928_36010 [Colwellia sp.]|nr:hypothetical protein [Colwellia sp.]
MKNKVETRNNIVFSMDPFSIFVGKYTARVGVLVFCILHMAVKLDILKYGTEGSNYKRPDIFFVAMLFMIFFMIVTDLLFRKFACKICFDLDKSEAKFFMFFPLIRKKIISVKIEEIDKIILNIYVTFLIGGVKVRYIGVDDKELVHFLENLKPITWKKLGRKINNGKLWWWWT